MILSAGERFETVITGRGSEASEYSFYVPKEVVDDAEQLTFRARAVIPRKPAGDNGRTLFMILDEVRVESLDRLPADAKARTLPPITWASPERAIDRIRHVERRPPIADPAAFADLLAAERANIVTLGTMNGKGYAFFLTDLAETDPLMDPAYLPEVIRQLRARKMKVFSWVVFNIQDTRKIDDYAIAKRYPQWQMKFIDDADRASNDKARVGMCVVSSPYIEHHAKLLRQAAAFDLDGFFFDGFYLGGIPHPFAARAASAISARRDSRPTRASCCRRKSIGPMPLSSVGSAGATSVCWRRPATSATKSTRSTPRPPARSIRTFGRLPTRTGRRAFPCGDWTVWAPRSIATARCRT